MPLIGGTSVSPLLHFPPYRMLSHDPSYSVLPTSNPLLPELRCDPWTPIEPSALSVDLPYLSQQLLIASLTYARLTPLPRIITTPRYLQHSTHTLYLVTLPVLSHKPILHLFRLENTAKAFFKMSLSSFTFSNSLRSLFVPASSGATRPLPTKALSPLAKNLLLHI